MPGTVIFDKDEIDLGFSPLVNFAMEPVDVLPAAGKEGRVVLDRSTGHFAGDDGAAFRWMAPLDSPVFTDQPKAPTAAEGDTTTLIATTEFVTVAVAAEAAIRLAADQAEEAARIAADDAETSARSAADTVLQGNIDAEASARVAADALKAPLASPALTGNPTAPTQSTSNDSTRLATTAFVHNVFDQVEQVPSGVIVMWSGSTSSIPSGWALCDGSNGTPNLVDRFIIGANEDWSGSPDVGDTGGSNTQSKIPNHSHNNGSLSIGSEGSHTHSSGSYSANSSGAHDHQSAQKRSQDADRTGTGYILINNLDAETTTDPVADYGSTTIDGNHSHSISGNSGGVNGSHTHGISGSTGTTGDGSSVDNRPSFYALAFIMKT